MSPGASPFQSATLNFNFKFELMFFFLVIFVLNILMKGNALFVFN